MTTSTSNNEVRSNQANHNQQVYEKIILMSNEIKFFDGRRTSGGAARPHTQTGSKPIS